MSEPSLKVTETELQQAIKLASGVRVKNQLLIEEKSYSLSFIPGLFVNGINGSIEKTSFVAKRYNKNLNLSA